MSRTLTIKPAASAVIFRGLRRRCPKCGAGRLFAGYLKVAAGCGHCDEALGHIRADDFPPYLTIVVVGHIVVPLVLLSQHYPSPPMWMEMAFWPTLTLVLTLSLLPFVKGGIVAFMWRLGLRGDEHQ